MSLQARQDDSDDASAPNDNRGGFFVTSTIINGYGFPQVITATVGPQALTTALTSDGFGFESLVTKVLPSESLITTTSINRLGYPVAVTRRITASTPRPTSSSSPSATSRFSSGSESSASSATDSTNTAAGLGSGATADSKNASDQTPSPQSQASSSGDGLSAGEIAAAVVVPLIVVAALLILGCCLLRRRRRKRSAGGSNIRSHPEMKSLAERPSTRNASPRPTIRPDPSVAPSSVDYLTSSAVTNGTSTEGKRSIEQPARSYHPNEPNGNARTGPFAAPTAPTSATLSGPPQLDDWRAEDIGRLLDPFGDSAHQSSSGATTASSRSVGLPIQGASTSTSHAPNHWTPGHEQKLSDVPSSGLVSNEPRTASRGAAASADDAISIASDVSYQEAEEAEVAEVAHARPTHMQRASVVQLTGNGNSPPREGGMPGGGHKHSRTKSSDAGFPRA